MDAKPIAWSDRPVTRGDVAVGLVTFVALDTVRDLAGFGWAAAVAGAALVVALCLLSARRQPAEPKED